MFLSLLGRLHHILVFVWLLCVCITFVLVGIHFVTPANGPLTSLGPPRSVKSVLLPDSLSRLRLCPVCCPVSVPEFTEQPSQLKGYSIHTRLSKGPRGFGFNIVGGSRPQEFLQVYSVTPGGPPALSTGTTDV